MNAIAYTFRCANCLSDFKRAEVPEGSYGLFVMRTDGADDAAYLNALEDRAFLESFGLLKQHALVANIGLAARGKAQQAVFTATCDLSVGGEQFKIGLQPKCPICGSRQMSSWEPVTPIQAWELPAVGHESWDRRTSVEKAAKIDQEIRRHFGKV